MRYDGGHKRNAVVVDLLDPSVEWVPVCPEVELGLGVPRPPIRLIGDGPRLVVETTGEDLSERMQRWARRRVAELRALDLHGYVLKSRSPSCGLDDVPVQGAERPGRGAFAAVLVEAFPRLAVEDEVRLADPVVRARFMERALAAARRH